MVADRREGEADQDRRRDRHTRPVRHVPVGRPVAEGAGARGPVRRDPAADRRTSAAAGAGVTRLVVMQSGKNHGRGVS